MAQDVRNEKTKKSRKRKKRDVCEENISKLNLDKEMSDDEFECRI